jgi:hypothetical protein
VRRTCEANADAEHPQLVASPGFRGTPHRHREKGPPGAIRRGVRTRDHPKSFHPHVGEVNFRHPLPLLLAFVLLTACGAETGPATIPPDAFVAVNVALRTIPDTVADRDSARAAVLEAHGVEEDDLLAFLSAHERDLELLATTWREITTKVDSIATPAEEILLDPEFGLAPYEEESYDPPRNPEPPPLQRPAARHPAPPAEVREPGHLPPPSPPTTIRPGPLPPPPAGDGDAPPPKPEPQPAEPTPVAPERTR